MFGSVHLSICFFMFSCLNHHAIAQVGSINCAFTLCVHREGSTLGFGLPSAAKQHATWNTMCLSEISGCMLSVLHSGQSSLIALTGQMLFKNPCMSHKCIRPPSFIVQIYFQNLISGLKYMTKLFTESALVMI